MLTKEAQRVEVGLIALLYVITRKPPACQKCPLTVHQMHYE